MSSGWDKTADTIAKGPGGLLKVVLIWVVIMSVIGGGITVGITIISRPFQVIDKALSADNIIYNYEYFKKQFRDIKAIDVKIEVAKGQKTEFKDMSGEKITWTFEDKTEYSRLSSIASGLEMQRADMVSDYNAKSAMVHRSIFKGDDCPQTVY